MKHSCKTGAGSATIGVLGLQGDFDAHRLMIERAGAQAVVVKKPEQLEDIDALIIPGGESTTLLKLIEAFDFGQPLIDFARRGKTLFGTCAGMILLAKQVRNPSQFSFGLIDITVERNGYGRQKESFQSSGTFIVNDRETQIPMVFIRAPRMLQLGEAVEPLAWHKSECVMARQDNIIVASFHPELTDDLTIHRFLLESLSGSFSAASAKSPAYLKV